MCLLSLVIRSIPININDSLSLFCVLSLFFSPCILYHCCCCCCCWYLHFLWNHRHCNLYELQVTRQRKHQEMDWEQKKWRKCSSQRIKNETTRIKCANSSMSLFLNSLIFHVVRIRAIFTLAECIFCSVDWLHQACVRWLCVSRSERWHSEHFALNKSQISNSISWLWAQNKMKEEKNAAQTEISHFLKILNASQNHCTFCAFQILFCFAVLWFGAWMK